MHYRLTTDSVLTSAVLMRIDRNSSEEGKTQSLVISDKQFGESITKTFAPGSVTGA